MPTPSLLKLVPPAKLPRPIAGFEKVIHGGDYNPDQWLSSVPTIVEEDARLMRLAGINSSSVAIFAWSLLEPAEGKYDFAWLDKVMHEQGKIGNKVILATPSGAMPAWLAEKYPEARRVDRQGRRAHYGARHNHCWTSPAYHDRVEAINRELARRYKGHPALAMWHVSNELNGECFCDLCRARWAKWLEGRYGTLGKVTDAYWAAFWSHQPSRWEHLEPTDWVVDGMMLDWLRFSNDCLIEWYRFERDGLKAVTPDVPVTTNFMTTTYSIDYQRLSREVDVVADDQYPGYDPDDAKKFGWDGLWYSFKNDLYRCMKPERTFFLMESCPGAIQWKTPQKLRRPGVLRLEMLQAMAAGADGTCYFQFRAGRGAHEKLHGAVVEQVIPAGDVAAAEKMALRTRRFSEVRALSASYEKMTGVLGTSVKPEVAVVYDWESRWAQRLSCGTGVEEHRYTEVAVEQYRAFWQEGVPADVVSPDRELGGYKLVILPQHWIMTPLLALKLRKYVEEGGTLVATWDTGMTDENNRLHLGGSPGCGLQEVLGLFVEETDRLADVPRAVRAVPGNALALPSKLGGREVAAIAQLTGATALAEFAEDFYTGKPAITVNAFGKGKAYFLATRLDEATGKAFYGSLMRRLHLERVIDADLPDGVTAQLRGAGDEAYVFLLNFTKETKTVPLGTRKLRDVESGHLFSGSLHLEPLAAHVMRMEV